MDNRARFEQLFRAHVSTIRAYARRGGDAATADHVVSDALPVCPRRREGVPELDDLPAERHGVGMSTQASEGPIVRWRKRRRARAALTGDTPEKQAEDRRRRAVGGDVGDAARRASTGLVVNGAPFNG